jgi:signal transduction histidine kinase/DNA-binding response OmpR family regulator
MPDTKASILLVDDRPDKLLALEAVLEDLNQKIVLAYSGREALRHVLEEDFAVILLDVNMPGMDGFETASLIRHRSNSRHTPIIFITAFGDEMHAARGYSLGAVDYILAPVLPEVLRTKVAVFVDLFVKTQQIKMQAESLERRAAQMQKLAAASLAINSSLSTEAMLRTITDTARDIIGAHQAAAIYIAEQPGGPPYPAAVDLQPTIVGSFSDTYTDWRDREIKLDAVAGTLIAHSRTATRLTDAEVSMHADWKRFSQLQIPPLHGGVLAAPLTGRNGINFGIVYLSDRYGGEFSQSDEAILVQLAQIGSVAIENTIYAQERQANRIKDEFLATLSHELRTPLNAILGWTQLMQLEKLEGEVAHGVEVIDRSAKAQTKLIEDLLDMSRITSGKLQMNLQRGHLPPIIMAAIDATRPAADAKQIEIAVSLADEDLPVMIDSDRTQQVVWNLLSNAVKFTPERGHITVDLRRRPGASSNGSSHSADAPWLMLRVTDTGRGIDAKFLPFVFDRFRQADSTSTRGHGGLGIGLTIVRQIVEQHGGKVNAASEGAGKGTIITVEFPAVRETPAEPAPVNGSEVGRKLAGPSLSGLNILVIDDDQDAREMIATMLRRAGANMHIAASVTEAMQIIADHDLNLVLSDIAMPEEDGFALIQKLRARPGEKGTLPAIALTAYARAEDRARALAAGFDAHLTKPISPNDLLSRAAELTRGRTVSQRT